VRRPSAEFVTQVH